MNSLRGSRFAARSKRNSNDINAARLLRGYLRGCCLVALRPARLLYLLGVKPARLLRGPCVRSPLYYVEGAGPTLGGLGPAYPVEIGISVYQSGTRATACHMTDYKNGSISCASSSVSAIVVLTPVFKHQCAVFITLRSSGSIRFHRVSTITDEAGLLACLALSAAIAALLASRTIIAIRLLRGHHRPLRGRYQSDRSSGRVASQQPEGAMAQPQVGSLRDHPRITGIACPFVRLGTKTSLGGTAPPIPQITSKG